MNYMKNTPEYGPQTRLSQEIDAMKYRQTGEDFYSKCVRIADALKDDDHHFDDFKDILREQLFPASWSSSERNGVYKRDYSLQLFRKWHHRRFDGQHHVCCQRGCRDHEARGGIGYDFSRIRPRGDRIKSLDSKSSGPVSFMKIFDAVCQTIASSGHRRGAQMGVMRIDHPDIEAFITAKHNSDQLTGFNVSIGVTDLFMECLEQKKPFPLQFDGEIYDEVDPVALWDMVMRSTWDWAEPGILFIDRINEMNNLYYCETIETSNPCGEQPFTPVWSLSAGFI